MKILHITNGDSTTAGLNRASVPGALSTYADVLHVGPVLPDDDMVRWQDTRSRFLADAGIVPYEKGQLFGSRWQRAFDEHTQYDTITIWLEHDLFDQLLLIRHLSWFARVGRTTGLELVQADDYLGLMEAARLAQLYEQRRPVSQQQFHEAQRVWRIFTSTDHSELFHLHETPALPYLADAIRRLLEEYPDKQTGLGRTDRQILKLLVKRAYTFAELFTANAALEEAMFMGDTIFRWHLRQLAEAPHPLIENGEMIRVTDAGRSVLAGRMNAIQLNGIDRWIGGVHIT